MTTDDTPTKEPKVTIYRYRVMWRSGRGKWEYRETTWTDDWDTVLKDELVNQLRDEHFHPDSFRKIERVEEPPKEWLQERVTELRRVAEWQLAKAAIMERLLA